ncbi:DUF2147 domain-containing protein [Parerythrobacter aurantius]|uniref:DUF2147 domain-containing protein n=1 Tax=Parerythrobacter aurantius TaxID=3127706 RepID=UPI0032568D0D
MKRQGVAFAGSLLVLACAAAPALAWFAPEPIAGRWMTREKDAVVTIAPCGASYCGKLSQYLVTPPGGADQKDVNNPDPKLRGRKLLGINLLSGFKADGDVWRGTIYDPRNGKSYRSVLKRKSTSALEVKGCIGPFCQAQTWTRAK